MFSTSYTLGHIWGIPLRLHFSLLLALFWVMGSANLLASLLFLVCLFASVTAHELGHCYVAQRIGCKVKEIKLTLIGGIASIYDPPTRPRDEILMAAAGPAVSIAIGLISLLLTLFSNAWMTPVPGRHILDNMGLMQVLPTLFVVNTVLGLFNLIPAMPLDGGRILRASLTRTKGYVPATFTTMRIGQIVAILLGIWGLFDSFTLVILAVFIYFSAAREYAMAKLQSMTGSVWYATGSPVGDNEVEISASPWSRNRRNKRIRIHRD